MTLRYLTSIFTVCLAAQVPVAHAAYPEKPIRLIVPWAAGGSTDALARAVAQRMSESMGQPVVVENRAGASGRIGAEAVAKAAPDGYTLGVIELAHTVAPSVFRQMPYDLLRDFTPVSLLGESPLVLFADSARYRPGEIQRFLADARKSGSALQLATSGNGTISHLAAKMLEAQAGIPVDAVPYRGSAPALTDVSAQLVAGHFATLASGSSLLGGGKIAALMVTGPARIPAAPASALERAFAPWAPDAAGACGVAVALVEMAAPVALEAAAGSPAARAFRGGPAASAAANAPGQAAPARVRSPPARSPRSSGAAAAACCEG